MPKHIFLTGPKQIGKSTIIQNYLMAHPVKCAGFITVKSETVFPGCRSVHMLDASCRSGITKQKNKKPSKENFLFFCGQSPNALYHKYELLPEPAPRFNRIGCTLLNEIPSDTELIIMDEIGPHEYKASAFRDSVLQCLDGNIPILGVLQKAESALYQRIAEHPNVIVIEVTRENRNQITFSFYKS